MSTKKALAGIAPALLAALLLSRAEAAVHRNEKVYQAAEANRAGALELLKEIVNIDSGTGDVEGGTKVEAVLRARLTQLGAEVRTEPAEAPGLPNNVVAVFHGTGKGKILIIAHIDTVFGPGTAAARPFSMDQQRAHGPGVGDEKAGVVNAITALKILHDMGFKNFATITLLLDDSEERGSPGSTQLIKRLAREHNVEFNMEPGDPPDALTVWRKGSAGIRIQVKGRAAHAGMAPQDGRNAAVELLHQLNALQGAFPTAGSGITVNLTVLRSGESEQHHSRSGRSHAQCSLSQARGIRCHPRQSRGGNAQHPGAGHDGDRLARPRLSAPDRECPDRCARGARAGHLRGNRQNGGTLGERGRIGVRARHGRGHAGA